MKHGQTRMVALLYDDWRFANLFEAQKDIRFQSGDFVKKGEALLFLQNKKNQHFDKIDNNYFAYSYSHTKYKDEESAESGLYEESTYTKNVYKGSLDDFIYSKINEGKIYKIGKFLPKTKEINCSEYYNKNEPKLILSYKKVNKPHGKYTTITITTKNISKQLLLPKYSGIGVHKLDDNNLLLAPYPYDNEIPESTPMRYSVNEDKFYAVDYQEPNHIERYPSIDVSKKYNTGRIYRYFEYINDNNYIQIIGHRDALGITDINLYEFKNDKFIRKNFNPPKNYRKKRVLSQNIQFFGKPGNYKVAFLGGEISSPIITRYTHSGCIYDIKNNRIDSIRDWPFYKLNTTRDLKDSISTDNGDFYLMFGNNDENTPITIYRFSRY